MTKPFRMWCVRTPQGQLLKATTAVTRSDAQAASERLYLIIGNVCYPRRWRQLKDAGYTVVRVRMEEE